MRVLQVGLGPWGLNWAEMIIPQITDIETVGFVARRETSLKNAQQVLGLAASLFFNSLDKALSEVDADAVLILTDTSSHRTLIETALAAGKHVLVEKPFTETKEQASLLAEQARKNGLILMVNQNFRFFPASQKALEIIRDQSLGCLDSVIVDFRMDLGFESYEAGRFHYERRHALLMDMSVHHFDLMRMVLQSEPKEIYCYAWNPPWSLYRDPASAVAMIVFQNGVIVNYRGSWLSKGQATTFSGDWHMNCEEGEIVWQCRGDRDLTTDGDQVLVRRIGQSSENITLEKMTRFGRAGVLAAFAKAVQTDSMPPYCSSAADNIHTIELMQAAVESAETGRVISIG